MYSSNLMLPARRSAAAIGAAVALAAGAMAVAPAAQAHPSGHSGGTSGGGSSTATVLRAGLDVSLVNKTVHLPLNVSLNDVKAPADAAETALTAKLDGVDQGKPFSMLRADVATAKATADAHKAEGYANLARAEVHLPGLPYLSLIKLEAVTSKATCETGRKPTASATLAGVWVLNKKVTLTATGTTKVAVPGVGEVSLDLTKTQITSRTAAATGLELKVKVNPLKLNVAVVSGTVTLVKATCETPKVVDPTTGGTSNGGATQGGTTNGGADNGGATTGGATTGGATDGGAATGGASSGGSTTGADSGGASGGSGGSSGGSAGSSGASGSGGTGSGGSEPQTGPTTQNLAETGSSSNTPLLAAGAGALVVVGGGALYLTSRRRKAAQAAETDA